MEANTIPPHSALSQLEAAPELPVVQSTSDLEMKLSVSPTNGDSGLAGGNSVLVTWEGEEDPSNPYNWPTRWKWGVTVLTSLGGLVTLMSGSMIAPALIAISEDLSIGDAEAQLTLSIFVLAFAFGPLILAPLTEVFGRRPVWILASLWYLVWNTVCGFARTKGLMVTARFLAGLGASGEFAVTNPVLSDCWRPEQRGRSFAISTFVALLGPAIGPILGGLISHGASWPWIFWTVSLFDALLIIWAVLFFRETYGPTILYKKVKILRKTRNGTYYTEFELSNPKLSTTLWIGLTRPCRLLATQPIIQLMSLYLAYNFGILYIVLSTFANLWINGYGQSVSTSGLHYLALAIGYTIAAQVGGPVTDRVWRHLQNKAGGATAPEYRVPLMSPSALLIPIGLFWYGWAAEARSYWVVTDIGVSIFGCGIILGTQAMQAYVMDSYTEYTASALAAALLLRSIAGFAFPTFAPALYEKLGYGWGNSMLAFAFIAIGLPAPIFLLKFGARIRARGTPQS